MLIHKINITQKFMPHALLFVHIGLIGWLLLVLELARYALQL